MITETQLRVEIVKQAMKIGTQKDAADKWGVSPQYLSDIITKRRDISDGFARKLGYAKAESRFVKLDNGKEVK